MKAVYARIQKTAMEACEGAGLSGALVEHFLRTGEQTWVGSGSGQFTRAQFHNDSAYRDATKAAIRGLFASLAELIPDEVRAGSQVAAETIRSRIEPMVTGLLPKGWREVALREITARLFVLNFPGAQTALEAELSTCDLGGAWRVLWLMFEDYGLKPDSITVDCDGMASDYAHVRWSAFEPKDPFTDVVVHEAAHMLHYLKPANFDLAVGRGQERFLDVQFQHRELFAYSCEAYSCVVVRGDRRARISFAETIHEAAVSFPAKELEEAAPLVLKAAQARNGWKVIREAVIHPRNGRSSG